MQAVFITSAVLSITCCLFSTSVQSSLRARCLPSLRARCLRYEDAVFVTCILSFTCTLSSLRAHRPRYAHTVFVTCILSSLRARCLRYVHTVFVTCILSVTYILSSLRAYCLRYIHTVFVTCILSVTCTLSSLRAHCLRYMCAVFTSLNFLGKYYDGISEILAVISPNNSGRDGGTDSSGIFSAPQKQVASLPQYLFLKHRVSGP